MKRIMTVIGVTLLLAVPSFAKEYDAEFKDAFMKECKVEVSANNCSCILADLETKVTQEQLTDLYHKASSGDDVKFEEMSKLVKGAKQTCNVK